jgi:CHAD domain-containing protein
MAYRFKRGQSVARAVPRIAGQQIDKALEALAAEDPHEAVHDARTTIKRLRGLLRLVHPWLGDRERKDTRRLRALADELGQLRDAEVLVQTFDRLWDHFEGELGTSVRRVRMRLVTRLRSVESELDRPARLQQSLRGFRKMRARVQRWVPRHARRRGGWKAIEGGLAETYAEGRRWFRRAGASNDDHAFHQWRRHVKYHGYHLQLLADLWPAELSTRGEELTRLGELLGEDHDLAVFMASLAGEPRCFDSATDRQKLFACIGARQAALRGEALPLGERLYAEKPGKFRRRMKAAWRRWWKQKPPRPGRAADEASGAAPPEGLSRPGLPRGA